MSIPLTWKLETFLRQHVVNMVNMEVNMVNMEVNMWFVSIPHASVSKESEPMKILKSDRYLSIHIFV